ncbi:MAG: hypothetical protein LBD92_03550 [Oscillospiraceae bacterium]|nr:hypothetical protein [Oscillospiraceae bacterium]
MKNLFICLIITFAALGVILYFNMFHLACVVSFLLALCAGAFFTRHLSKQSEQRLSEQENLRKRLTADVAHELRTPLAAVASHLEAMTEGIWEPTPERLSSCREEILRIATLVADLQQLAQIDGDNLKLSRSAVNLLELTRVITHNFAAETAKKDISAAVSGDACEVSADRDRISQVITNLISNAVKFTPDGGHISVTVTDAENSGVIEICDDGTGIAESELPYIFERFYRTDKSRSRKTGGAGVGLTIARSIVEAHGGTVRAENRAGGGSHFTVTLPK